MEPRFSAKLRFRSMVIKTHPKGLLHPVTSPGPEGHLSSSAKDGYLAGNPGSKGLGPENQKMLENTTPNLPL